MTATRPRRIAALARRACVMIGVGVILTVASAWGFAAFARIPAFQYPNGISGKELYEFRFEDVRVHEGIASVMIERGPGIRRYSQNFEKGQFVPSPRKIPTSIVSTIQHRFRDHKREEAFDRDDIFTPGAQRYRDDCFDETAGWPTAALTHNVFIAANSPRVIQGGIGLPIDLGTLPHRRLFALPWRPLWHGIALNTAFYASLVWLTLFGLGALRRTRRTGRGLCPTCAYDRRGIASAAPCPECGETPDPAPVSA